MDIHDLTTDETGSATADMEDLTPRMNADNQSNDDPDVSHLDSKVQATSEFELTKS
jgi:hypothetical protein